jgi:hypothetical protein
MKKFEKLSNIFLGRDVIRVGHTLVLMKNVEKIELGNENQIVRK